MWIRRFILKQMREGGTSLLSEFTRNLSGVYLQKAIVPMLSSSVHTKLPHIHRY